MNRVSRSGNWNLCFLLSSTLVWILPGQAASAEDTSVSFRSDVAPILLDNCVACHNAKKAEGGYRIDSFTELSKAGDSGIAPLEKSTETTVELLRRLTTEDESERMPAESEALTAAQIKVVTDWIEAGSAFDGPDPDELLPFVIPPREHPESPATYPARLQVTALTFSRDDHLLYSGGYHEILAWDADGNLQGRIGNVGQQTYALSLVPGKNQLAVASGSPGFGGEVRIIDLSTHKVTTVLARCNDVILDMAFRPDGKELAVAAADKSIRILDMETLETKQTLLSHADFVTAIAWSRDGKQLVSASRDKSAKVFNAETGQLLISYQGHANAVRGVHVLPDGKQVVSAGNDHKLHRWNISDAKKTAEVAIGGEGYRIASAENCVLVPSSDNRLLKIDLSKNQVTTQFKGHEDWVLTAAVSSDQTRVATGAHDGEIKIWNLVDGALINSWIAQPPVQEAAKTEP